MCLNCGSIYCLACDWPHLTRDLLGRAVGYAPCPRCNKERDLAHPGDRRKLEKLIKESPHDPRKAHWLISLGGSFHDGTPRGEQKAIEHYTRAGELGYGEGFSRIAEIHCQNGNWVEAKQFYQKGADLMHVIAIANLANEAALGYFGGSEIVQQDNRRPPDLEESFRLFREGVQLGDPGCCTRLGQYYLDGTGTSVNLAKGFKWSKVAAEKGDAQGMAQCAECCLYGKGVEQSDEQAIYW